LTAPVGGHDEEVGRTVDGPTHAVEAELEVGDAAGRLVLLLLLPVALLVALPGGEGESPAVGRPGDVTHLVLPRRDRAGLAPAGRNDADLGLLRVVLVTHEGKGAAVGRPARLGILVLPGRERAGLLRPVGGHHPD